MKDKKHIDKLFKDRFNDFEVSPSPEVWGSIQTSIEKRKKDRNLIPLWWKMGGVAALLALLLTVGNSVFNSSEIDSPIVTNDETTRSIDNDGEKNLLIKAEKLNQEVVASEENESKDSSSETENSSEIKSENNSNSKESIYQKAKSTQDAVAVDAQTPINKETESNSPINNNRLIKDKFTTVINSEKETIATTSEKVDRTNTEVQKNDNPLIKKDFNVAETTKTDIAASDTKTNKQESQETVNVETAKVESKKQSILEAIDEQKTIKEEEAVAEKSSIDRRWEVAPNFAPVYYSSLGEGSSIDPSFANNSQSGEVNFSYGVQVSYALSERLSVRSGVSNVDLSYATGGVELGTGPVSAALQSVDYGGRSIVLTAVDKESAQNNTDGYGEITLKATNGEAEIVQNISYYEVPVELKYAVINKKIGVNVIGGVSTLFLGNNQISVNAGDFASELGEANNLSTVSFSTNVGLGFDYKLSKKFKVNIEPMFKYQLNPYSDSSVDFKPYYMGVYTGLSYKF
jgi:hypothetical protein